MPWSNSRTREMGFARWRTGAVASRSPRASRTLFFKPRRSIVEYDKGGFTYIATGIAINVLPARLFIGPNKKILKR